VSATVSPKKGKLRDTPLSFAEVILKMPLYNWQGKILFAVEKGASLNRLKVAVVAPNAAGKSTRIVAVSALRWLYKYPKGKVICTSADSRQIDLQLMPALHQHRGVFRSWEFLSRQIRTPQGGFFNAFTTDEPGRAEGHHCTPEAPLLMIADEAKSIPEPIFEAFDRCSFNVLLLISSPGLMQGRLYNCFTSQRDSWITFKAGLSDCPHVSKERIDDVITSYGPEHPFTRSTLHGEFMAEEEGTSFAVSLRSLQAILETPPAARLSHRERYAFCDFACGGDENVIAIRSGNQLESLVCWRERDTMSAVGRFIIEFSRAGLSASQIWGDDGGAGRVMIDALAQAGWSIHRFNFGAKAGNDFAYVSRGAEVWTGFGKQVTGGEVVLLRDETLIAQLTSRKTTFDSRGRIGLEKKEDMRARGLKSPDRADAVVGVFGSGSGFANSTNRRFASAPSSDPMAALTEYYEGYPRQDDYEERNEYSRAGLSDPGY
jgi:phage terminase large subunit